MRDNTLVMFEIIWHERQRNDIKQNDNMNSFALKKVLWLFNINKQQTMRSVIAC